MVSPRDAVMSLVCGMAKPSRSNRLIMMLQAFLDDSDMGGEGFAAILAGWVAPSATWLAFADDWQRVVLDQEPALRVFKPSTYTLRSEREKHRLLNAISTIKKHNLRGIVSIIPHIGLDAIVKPAVKGRIENPYFMALYSTVYFLVETLQNDGTSEPVDFVFDRQPGQEAQIHDAWEDVRAAAAPEVRAILRNPPIFRADEDQTPLQAAHMLAWGVRRMADDLHNGKPYPEWLAEFEKTELAIFPWTPDQLAKLASAPLGLGVRLQFRLHQPP